MEGAIEEAGEARKEPLDRPLSEAADGAKMNGEINGSLDEVMEAEDSENLTVCENSVLETSSCEEANLSVEPKDSEESMDVDSNCEVPSDLSIKSEVHYESDDNVNHDSIENGPSADGDESKVDESNDDVSEPSSEQIDLRSDVKVEKIDNKVDIQDGASGALSEQDKEEHTSDSDHEDSEELDQKSRTLQNGDSQAEGSDADEAKDLSGGKSTDDTPSPTKADNEKRESGESEGSPETDETTPTKKGKGRKNPVPLSLTPRRSSRNLNKQKSYVEDKEDIQEKDDGSDIEEIALVDPLAGAGDQHRENKENSKSRNSRGPPSKTIVVNDTKHLVEIASGSKQTKGLKKEPTLVIIDTNSILSGRTPIPIQQNKLPQRPGLQITPALLSSSSSSSSSSIQQSFSVLPVSSHSQALFCGGVTAQRVSTPPAPAPPPKPPVILPSLTDDMYVVEAPSFIVPYVYEKPPIKPLKDFIENLEDLIKKQKEEEEKRKKQESEKKEADKKEADKKEADRKEADKKEADKKEADKKEADKKEADRKEAERIEADSKEAEKKESDVEEGDKEAEKKEDINEESEKEECGKMDGAEKESSGKETEEVEPADGKREEEDEADSVKKTGDCEKMDVDSSKAKKEGEDSKKDVSEESTVVKEKVDSDAVQEANLKSAEKKENSSNDTKEVSKGETDEKTDSKPEEPKKPLTYFDNPLGKFFMQIGVNLVQEHVQTDLLRSQKKKRDREGGKGGASTQMAISSLQQTLEYSKENNEPFHLKQKKCDYCSFKTESALVMAHHMETPHMRNYIYRCNFCPLEVRSPHDILFHMEAEHNVRGRLERGPAFHQCPNCPFEDNQKGKLTRHLVSCQKKYRAEKNQEPPLDWEPPAKIPRVSRSRPFPMGAQGVGGLPSGPKPGMGGPHPLLPKLSVTSPMVGQSTLGQVANNLGRGRGRPPVQSRLVPDLKHAQVIQQQRLPQPMSGMFYRPSPSGSSPQVLVPTSYQIAGNQIYQNSKGQASKLQQQPSISITPLPRQPSGTPPHAHSTGMGVGSNKPGHPSSGGKATFVICEICDGYIKDLEQLRNHMQWIHKVKIHPKMIYNRPPLNCQKCQFRFFTDQGLERHLLGSHGLVTSSMQEAANKGKDGGRCPVCGRVYQWKLLNHVARDHSMTLKPAHLSYKCTVCTATFGMYKQFENHVYSAHSVVAKRVMEKKPGASGSPMVSRAPGQSQQGDSLLKPLKINDEITIIPQPARSARPGPPSRSGPLPAHLQGNKVGAPEDRARRPGSGSRDDDAVQIIDLDDSPSKDSLSAVQERLRRRTSLEVSQVETEDDVASPPAKKNRRD